ncbi:MAG: YetF domain-containing protein [Christensenellales bacterium]
MRANGVMNIHEVGTAVLETNGTLSVFPLSAKRAVSPEDMNLTVPPDEPASVLIADGERRDKYHRPGRAERPTDSRFSARAGRG